MDKGKLCLTLKFGDIVTIGDSIITFEYFGKSQVRLKISAPKSIKIERHSCKKDEHNEPRKRRSL